MAKLPALFLTAALVAGCATSPTWLGGCDLKEWASTGIYHSPVDTAECRRAVNWANENPPSDVQKIVMGMINIAATVGWVIVLAD